MQKIIKLGNKVIVILENGNTLESTVTKEQFQNIVTTKNDSEIIAIVDPNYKKKIDEYNKSLTILEKIRKSKLLTLENNTIYWYNISKLSVPKELAESVIDAELNNDNTKLTAYKNFWTLMSLNPSKECRDNLFWFLKKYGLTIAKCGFFVAYRNVDTTDEPGVYTDNYSHTFKIKVGEMVTMPRKKCNCDSNVECSRGLHCSSKGWLKRNYCGSVGLACLVNPYDVVAVPKDSEYGKLRTCAYLPIEVIHYDENDDIIPINIEDGFDCSYVTKVIYEGIMGNEKDSTYRIQIPTIPEFSKESIQDQLLEIAKKCIINKSIN